jgi:lipopolysaccharide export system protein LptC
MKLTMRGLARVLPVVVGLFVVLVAGLLVSARNREAQVAEGPASGGPPAADLRMKDVEIDEQSGTVRWSLKAEHALVYERERRTTIRTVSVTVHDEDRTWTIVADEGDIRERDAAERATPSPGERDPAPRDAGAGGRRAALVRDVDVRGNVVVTSSDGYRIETSRLLWDGEGRRLWTDAPVTLTRAGGTVIRGETFELSTADERAMMRRVRAVFGMRER